MLYLKEANFDDIEEEYRFITGTPEDEIYLEVNKDNPASLRVQMKCGAYIHHEDGEHCYMRVGK